MWLPAILSLTIQGVEPDSAADAATPPAVDSTHLVIESAASDINIDSLRQSIAARTQHEGRLNGWSLELQEIEAPNSQRSLRIVLTPPGQESIARVFHFDTSDNQEIIRTLAASIAILIDEIRATPPTPAAQAKAPSAKDSAPTPRPRGFLRAGFQTSAPISSKWSFGSQISGGAELWKNRIHPLLMISWNTVPTPKLKVHGLHFGAGAEIGSPVGKGHWSSRSWWVGVRWISQASWVLAKDQEKDSLLISRHTAALSARFQLQKVSFGLFGGADFHHPSLRIRGHSEVLFYPVAIATMGFEIGYRF